MSSNPPKQNSRFNLDDYVTVNERVEKFYERYPDGRIITNVIEINHETGFVLMQAMIYRTSSDTQPAATGHAFEVRGDSYINKNSFIENCETGAVGRALALLGFEVKRGTANREEVEKASRVQTTDKTARQPSRPPIAEETINLDADILRSAGELGYDAAKVSKWINQKYEVTGGLGSLTAQDKNEVLRVFEEKVRASKAKQSTAK